MRRFRSCVPFALSLALVAAACSGESPTTPSPSPAPSPSPTPGPTPGQAQLQIGGQYQIAQQAGADTCGQGTQIPSVTATVTHAAGASTFVMADSGGTTFNGTVQTSGAFTATARLESGGQVFDQRLEGSFTAGGFTGQLAVTVQPRNCAFTRAWAGTKQGAPNVIPLSALRSDRYQSVLR